MGNRSRNFSRLYNRLTDNPLFTLLFLQEAIKIFVTAGFEVTSTTGHFLILTVISAVLWALSDADVNWYETVVGSDGGDD